MASLSETQLLHLLLALGVTLVFARGLGEAARRLGQPEVLGQLLAGVVLGPSLLGPLLPGVYDALFGDPPAANGLSAISWIGAIFIFLTAGTEADLRILRARARSGLFVAFGAVVPSIAVGTLLGWLVLGQEPIAGTFLGVVLSVTAVSVLVSILDERGAMHRDYGQILLAAGVVTEMTVWVFIPVLSASLSGSPSPWVAALVALAGVAGVFLFMLSVGQAAVHWSLRWAADHGRVLRAPISVILVVTLLSAALSQALGLHPLLGAFAAGMVLVRAPRVRPPLLQSVQTLTTGFLAPLFFAFAGTRVNLRELGGFGGLLDVLVLLVGVTAVKVAAAVLMGRLSGLPRKDATLVGLGMNLKGGTDVIVALVGTELGFFTERIYSIYGTVAVLTVLMSAPVISRLDRDNRPGEAEQRRLDHEAAVSGGYLSRIERVLAARRDDGGDGDEDGRGADGGGGPGEPGTTSRDEAPRLLETVLEAVGDARRRQGLSFDLVRVEAEEVASRSRSVDLVVHELSPSWPRSGAPRSVSSESARAARQLQPGHVDIVLTSGSLPSRSPLIRRIVVPFDGRPSAFAAVDLALCLAEAHDAEVIPVRVRPAASTLSSARAEDPTGGAGAGATSRGAGASATMLDELRARDRQRSELVESARAVDETLAGRISPDGPSVHSVVVGAPDVARALLDEAALLGADLLVMGAIADRGIRSSRIGRTVDAVLDAGTVPVVVVIPR